MNAKVKIRKVDRVPYEQITRSKCRGNIVIQKSPCDA